MILYWLGKRRQTKIRLLSSWSISLKLNKASDEDECVDQRKYQSAIGSLMYPSMCTRPDIA